MKKKRILFLTFIGLIYFSFIGGCGKSKKNDFKIVTALPVSDTLQGQRNSFKGKTQWFQTFAFLNIDDQYLAISEIRENNFLHLFKLPELNFLYDWGQKGRGPEEFPFPPTGINIKNSELILYDGVSQQMSKYKVTDTMLVQTREPYRFGYEGQMSPLDDLMRLNDTLYVADYGLEVRNPVNEFIALQSTGGDSLFTFGKFPDTELEGSQIAHEFVKSRIAQPNGSKFAAFYLYHNMFKIFHASGERLKTIHVNDPYLDADTEVEDFIYRKALWASERYIYLLGQNGTNEEIYEKPTSSVSTTLEIWNWNGQPVYRAGFDRVLRAFTVSEELGKLYGILYEDTDQIYEYDLSTLPDSVYSKF